MTDELEQRIRERAHLIWEREGRPTDRADAHWSAASAEIAAEATPVAGPKPPRKAAAARPKATPGVTAATPKRRKPTAKAD